MLFIWGKFSFGSNMVFPNTESFSKYQCWHNFHDFWSNNSYFFAHIVYVFHV